MIDTRFGARLESQRGSAFESRWLATDGNLLKSRNLIERKSRDGAGFQDVVNGKRAGGDHGQEVGKKRDLSLPEMKLRPDSDQIPDWKNNCSQFEADFC